MRKTPTILLRKEYGKININIKDIMDSRGMTRNFLARAADTRFEVIDKWYKNRLEKIDLDILARVCYILGCTPGDIIEYQE